MTTATIEIQNETTCRITGLDVETRRLLSKHFSYEIPGARHMPAVRLGRWDGRETFFSLAAQTYVNLLNEIIPILEKERYDIVLDDQRQYDLTQFEFESVAEDSYSHVSWPATHQAAGSAILLRDYQVTAINEFLRNPQSLQKLPTGSGKTLVCGALSHKCEKYGRTIVIVPNKTLVNQTEEDYKNLQLDVGVFFGDRKEFGRTHTICTWQSLNILLKNTKNESADITIQEFLKGVCCVIIDEVHGVRAKALRDLLTGVMSHIQIRWGLTGTIPKEDYDFRSLQVAIGEIVNSMQASDLQDAGVLANCHVYIKQLVEHVEYKEYQTELKYLLETKHRLQYLADLISEIGSTGNTLVLIDRVAPGKELVSMIPGSVFVSGATKTKARKEQYDEVTNESNKILVCTFGVASTGINIVEINNVVLVEPGKSFVRVIQSIGRGLRKSKDKDFVDIYDITSTCKFSKRHLTVRKKFYAESKYEYSVEKVVWQ